MIARAAREIAPGMVVNLGIGMPTKVVDYLSDQFPVCLHTGNGLTGVGPSVSADKAGRNLIDAGRANFHPVRVAVSNWRKRSAGWWC